MTFASHLVRAVSVTAVVAGAVAVLPGGAGAAAPGFCSVSYSGTTITWTGGASGSHKHEWNDPDNWNPSTVPDEGQDGSTFQTQYVCIGGGASVNVASGDSYHVAGLDVGESAQLVVGSKGGLYLGAAGSDDLVPSYVEKGSDVSLVAATLGGNATVDVAGTLDWAGVKDGIHRLAATQSGEGTTVIKPSGKILVDGRTFGATVLSEGRTIDNFGTLKIGKVAFISMTDGTALNDEPGSTLALAGEGGIYPNQPDANAGAIIKSGKKTSVLGVPTTTKASFKPVVKAGGLTIAAPKLPKLKLPQNTSFGVGSCDATDRQICHESVATKPVPQVAVLTTSPQAPKKSAVKVGLVAAPKKIKGSRVIGRSIAVTAPSETTTHSTDLIFKYDASMKGVKKANEPVFRNKHKITICHVSGLTAVNTSCVLSQKIVKGDLEIHVISIQPNATWTVA
jgi:hypothetical protein